MRRYLLVLDMDLLAMDEEHDLKPISHLVAWQEQDTCEVVVLSLVDTQQARLPAMELLLGAQVGKFPVAPARPRHQCRHYDEVILATGRQDSPSVARVIGRDPVQRLRRKLGSRLTVF